MKTSRVRRVLGLMLFSVVGSASVFAAAGIGDSLPANARLEGTWRVAATFVDPPDTPPSEVLLTFTPGRSSDEGALIDTNSAQLVPNPVCTPDQGVWKRVKRHEFIATHFNYCFDATAGFAPAGPTKVRDRIVLGADGAHFSGTQYIEGFDTNGNVVFVGRVNLAGERIEAEAPPAN
jgi:hypothetical protein